MSVQKRTRRMVGQVVEIDLGDGLKAYGRVLEEPLLAFYDKLVRDGVLPPLTEVADWPVAFKIWVMNHAITKGRWKVIGSLPLSADMQVRPGFFKQDAMNGRLSIYDYDAAPNYERPASRAECETLECAAVWDPEHVEDRLRDHFAGRPSKWTESLRIKPASDWT